MTSKKKSTQASSKNKTGQKHQDNTRSTRGSKRATSVVERAATPVTPSIIAVTMVPAEPAAPATALPSAPAAVLSRSHVASAAVPTATDPTPVTSAPLTIGMFQKRLQELGCYDGQWDGIYGPLTRDAVCRFQAREGLAVSGDATADTLKKMGMVPDDFSWGD